MNTATITYYLSEAGRKASLMACEDGKRKQELVGKLTPDTADLFSVDDNGNATVELHGGWAFEGKTDDAAPKIDCGVIHMPYTVLKALNIPWKDCVGHNFQIYNLDYDAPLDWSDAITQLRDRPTILEIAQESILQHALELDAKLCAPEREARENERAAQEAKKTAEKAAQDKANKDVIDWFVATPDARGRLGTPRYYSVSIDHPTLGTLKIDDKTLFSEAQRRETTDAQARDQEKQAFVSDWIALYGTDDQKERLDAGLLPKSEYLTDMENQVFGPLSEKFQSYEKITATEVREAQPDEDDCDDTEPCDFRVVKPQSIDSCTWKAFKAIHAALPTGGQAKIREHQAERRSYGEGSGVIRYGVQVKLTLGPFTFTREFAA